MKLFTSKNRLRLLALVMVFCMALGCFSGCGIDSKDDDDDHKGGSKGDLVKYEWDGLIYYLDEDFEKTVNSNNTYAMHTDGELTLIVAGAAAEDGITDSNSAAQAYMNNVQSACTSIEIKNKNGVSYTVMELDDGTTETRGFYVYEGYVWQYYIITYDYDTYSKEMISYITSAEIDKDYQHGDNSSSNGGNSGNSGNSGSNGNSGNNGNSENSGTPGTPIKPNNPNLNNLVKHEWDGLAYYLRDTYSTTDGGDYVMHVSGDTVVMIVSGEAPAGATDSKSFAQLYVNDMAESSFYPQVTSSNGIYYTVTDWGDGTTEVRGFYIYNGYGWNIYGTTYDYDVDGANLITYVTSGEIDKNYQHNTNSSSGNSGSTSNGSSGNVAPNPNAPSDTKEVTVYAYVPSSWGTPGCWAWSSATKTDAFEKWPGDTMLWIGKYYVSQIPVWVDSVIINGNGGSIQTEDISIESGKNVWIVIHADGSYYSLFYSEPTNADFASMGY